MELNLGVVGRRCQARVEESVLGGHFGMSKDGEVCRSITGCRCRGRQLVRLKEEEEVGRRQAAELELCSGGGGGREPWKGLE